MVNIDINSLMLIFCTLFFCIISIVVMSVDIRKNPLKKRVKQSDAIDSTDDSVNAATELSGDSDKSIAENSNIFTPGIIAYSAVMIMATIGIALMMIFVYKDNEMLFSLKRLCLLSVMWPIALIDAKSYRIPNLFIIYGLILRVVVFVFELIGNGSGIKYTLLSEGLAVGALLIVSVLCAFLIKNSIGFGDIKLFVVMGLFLGMEGIWSSMFASLIVSFVVSVFCLITKKKSRKDSIPFGPALVFGTYMSVFLTGM